MNGCDVGAEGNSEDNRAIGVRIRQLREAMGLSQEAFAHSVAKVSVRQVGRWESGDVPKRTTLEALAEACGVSFGWLMLGEAAPSSVDPAWRDGVTRYLSSAVGRDTPAVVAIELLLAPFKAMRWSPEDPGDIHDARQHLQKKISAAGNLVGSNEDANQGRALGGASGVHPADEVSGTQRKDAMRPAGTKDAKPSKVRR